MKPVVEVKYKRETFEIDMVKEQEIDPGDLQGELAKALKRYCYIGFLYTLCDERAKRTEAFANKARGSVFSINKENELDNGKTASDQYCNAIADDDEEYMEVFEDYLTANTKARRLGTLLRGIGMKIESLRTLISSERAELNKM